ncbi:hypothetical protein FNV62_07425 [Streptomyces sp. RLB3-17]|uniref:hypothetical protein n=1 Tax=unclassified Streptomyces TaxID=2593676 RepID=UPI001162FCB5|nr:hypothetical protein [Streptomyces sp. RLA2-12]QDN55458.1 hypothetical protein FNV67_09185 [Streptomyces sp. S1D4-20]QDN65636.1 hypothetical protein FNV66_08780 [Streptomyces sp. S1D4-14]QDN96278.1 hypothetical protein FNV58_09920 [Streptomyces sp. RLB1-9]QDO17987.1 hypothetical protein FNV65_08370 [Streptomyces sp. S1A1-8]QDO28114.1 hypothetical protein FNV63_08385 [Streptomyces sp. S1A1-3]QDO38004.1 hypothetical protein FNV62_07425 [Streptomyces sp. RLB3-17]QDO48041.1 hypothetical prote
MASSSPLARSGASTWTPKEREAYANDLDDPRALITVSATSNRSKADKDPTQLHRDRPLRHPAPWAHVGTNPAWWMDDFRSARKRALRDRNGRR